MKCKRFLLSARQSDRQRIRGFKKVFSVFFSVAFFLSFFSWSPICGEPLECSATGCGDSITDNSMASLMAASAAVSGGDLETVKDYIKDGLSANASIGDGITLLMQASNADMVKLLIGNGADVKALDTRNWTVLHHLATVKSDIETLKIIIAAGVDINRKNNDGETPLRLSGILFTENIAPEWGEQLIESLAAAGADIDAPDNNGHTLLHQAAFNDNARLALACIKAGANPDIKTSAEASPRQTAMNLKAKAFLAAVSTKD